MDVFEVLRVAKLLFNGFYIVRCMCVARDERHNKKLINIVWEAMLKLGKLLFMCF
jgi:hypothetical protein